VCELYVCSIKSLEKGIISSNRVECHVGIIKSNVKIDLNLLNSQLVFWNYCVERQSNILSASVRDLYLLEDIVPYTKMTS